MAKLANKQSEALAAKVVKLERELEDTKRALAIAQDGVKHMLIAIRSFRHLFWRIYIG